MQQKQMHAHTNVIAFHSHLDQFSCYSEMPRKVRDNSKQFWQLLKHFPLQKLSTRCWSSISLSSEIVSSDFFYKLCFQFKLSFFYFFFFFLIFALFIIIDYIDNGNHRVIAFFGEGIGKNQRKTVSEQNCCN